MIPHEWDRDFLCLTCLNAAREAGLDERRCRLDRRYTAQPGAICWTVSRAPLDKFLWRWLFRWSKSTYLWTLKPRTLWRRAYHSPLRIDRPRIRRRQPYFEIEEISSFTESIPSGIEMAKQRRWKRIRRVTSKWQYHNDKVSWTKHQHVA